MGAGVSGGAWGLHTLAQAQGRQGSRGGEAGVPGEARSLRDVARKTQGRGSGPVLGPQGARPPALDPVVTSAPFCFPQGHR